MAALAFACAAVFVPVVKSLLHRDRPLPNYSGAEAFSFPSGHATLSIAVLGTVVVILAHNLPTRWKSVVYAGTGAALALVALSRVYLLAHWPSDVLAGLLFGGSLVLLLAFLLRGRDINLQAGKIALAVAVVYGATYALHVNRGYADALTVYSRPLPVADLSTEEWLKGRWKEVPPNRVLFDGEFAEPLILQTDLPLTQLETALLRAGWREHAPAWLTGFLAHLLPFTGSVAELAPLQTYNGGRPPLATFTQAENANPATRLVLRIWETPFSLKDTSASRPLLTASVTRETSDPVLLGYQMSEITYLDPATEATTAASVASTIASPNGRRIQVGPSLSLVVASQ
jgi:undecaprenyl-diphosphatase